jgi:hypothetical protein
MTAGADHSMPESGNAVTRYTTVTSSGGPAWEYTDLLHT